MLKPFITITACLVLSVCFASIGQKSTQKKVRLAQKASHGNETAHITADKIVSDGGIITYLDNVSVTTAKVTARKAKKAIYDRRTNKITIWGSKEFVSKCTTIGVDTGVTEDRVEYVLGSGLVRVF